MEDSRGVGGGLANDGFRNHPTRAMVTSLVPLVYIHTTSRHNMHICKIYMHAYTWTNTCTHMKRCLTTPIPTKRLDTSFFLRPFSAMRERWNHKRVLNYTKERPDLRVFGSIVWVLQLSVLTCVVMGDGILLARSWPSFSHISDLRRWPKNGSQKSWIWTGGGWDILFIGSARPRCTDKTQGFWSPGRYIPT